MKIIILNFTNPFVKNPKTPYFASDENLKNDHKNRFFRKVHKCAKNIRNVKKLDIRWFLTDLDHFFGHFCRGAKWWIWWVGRAKKTVNLVFLIILRDFLRFICFWRAKLTAKTISGASLVSTRSYVTVCLDFPEFIWIFLAFYSNFRHFIHQKTTKNVFWLQKKIEKW